MKTRYIYLILQGTRCLKQWQVWLPGQKGSGSVILFLLSVILWLLRNLTNGGGEQ